ncbi:hypothetical protein [Streptomyces sp. NPDC056154]|uniref:hypothetical protein n=1 Tax=unclassified Streptomyces TaxID=2593676 RepID=UPI0035E24EDE
MDEAHGRAIPIAAALAQVGARLRTQRGVTLSALFDLSGAITLRRSPGSLTEMAAPCTASADASAETH